MDRRWLKPIGSGFYVDINRQIYFDVREFIAAHDLPDTPEIRQQLWDEVRQDFGAIGVTDLTES
jgi:hypothetical protein